MTHVGIYGNLDFSVPCVSLDGGFNLSLTDSDVGYIIKERVVLLSIV